MALIWRGLTHRVERQQTDILEAVTDGMPWGRAFVVWVLMAAVEVFHGALRRLYLVPVVGDWRARQVGAVIGAVLVFVIALITIRWVGASSRRALLQTGVFWLLLMVSFEMLGGRLAGYTWARIGSDYDLRSGGLLGLGMVVVALAPLFAARLRPSQRPS